MEGLAAILQPLLQAKQQACTVHVSHLLPGKPTESALERPQQIEVYRLVLGFDLRICRNGTERTQLGD